MNSTLRAHAMYMHVHMRYMHMHGIIHLQRLWWNCVHTFPAPCCNRNLDANAANKQTLRNKINAPVICNPRPSGPWNSGAFDFSIFKYDLKKVILLKQRSPALWGQIYGKIPAKCPCPCPLPGSWQWWITTNDLNNLNKLSILTPIPWRCHMEFDFSWPSCFTEHLRMFCPEHNTETVSTWNFTGR